MLGGRQQALVQLQPRRAAALVLPGVDPAGQAVQRPVSDFTMADNLVLSDRIRRRYERLYTGVFYQRFVLGQWVATASRA